MLRRKFYNRLLEWKKKEKKMPLLVKGARQVGKTFIIRQFAKTYATYVELNFLENPEHCRVFEGALDAAAGSMYSLTRYRNAAPRERPSSFWPKTEGTT